MKIKKIPILIAGFCLILLVGCMQEVKEGFVARDWAANMRELGFYPVYAPAEAKVEVGNVYIMPIPIEVDEENYLKEHHIPDPILLGNVEINKKISKFLQSCPELPKTPNPLGLDEKSLLFAPQPTYPEKINIFERERKLNRYPLAGLPEFMRITYEGIKARSFIPTEFFNLGMGFASDDVERASISVPAAEFISVPAPLVLDRISYYSGEKWYLDLNQICLNCKQIGGIPPFYIKIFGDFNVENVEIPERVTLAVVTGVYLARAIDITINFNKSFALNFQSEFNSSFLSLLNKEEKTVALKTSKNKNEKEENSKITKNASDDAEKKEKKIIPSDSEILCYFENILSGLPISSPGIQTSFVSMGAGGIGLRRTFEHPIVIGWTGLFIDVDRKSYEVLGPAYEKSTFKATLKSMGK
jgi:hypothetical protein